MHRSILLALLCAAVPAAADDVADLIAIDQRQQRAYVDRDWKVLDEIFTDDYVLVTSSGRELTKTQVLAAATASGMRWDVNETRDWQVRVHGDTAIVVATLHQQGMADGAPFDSVVRFSDTYVREDGTWRNVHAHASKVASAPQ